MVELLHSASCARIHYHPTARVLEVEWLAFSSGEEFRDVLRQAISLAIERGATGWLANSEHMRTLREADQQWLLTEFMPVFSRLELQRFAMVRCRDAMARMSLANVTGEKAAAFLPSQVREFETRTGALAWLGQSQSEALSEAA